MKSPKSVDCSIIIPVYYNEGALSLTMRELNKQVLEKHPELNWELVFVDDGSGDKSLDELLCLQEQQPDIIRIAKLTRNFGQVSAILAGITLARGSSVIIMSADNQDPANLINQMLVAFHTEGFDIVICTRKGRDESAFRVWTSQVFYRLMRMLSFPDMPKGGFDYVMLSRRVVQAILRNRDAAPFFQGQILWTGYPIKFIEYRRREREIGKSRWTFSKKLTYLIDGLLSYSFTPIRLMSVLGMIVAVLGFLYAIVVFCAKVIFNSAVQGWTPLMIVILVIGGLQMIMLGVIGEYLWRVLAQVRNHDQFIIEEIYEQEAVSEAQP